MLADGDADMVSMARPLLADPDWVQQGARRPRRRDQHLHRLQPGLPRPRVREQARHLPGQSARLPRDRARRSRRPRARSASPWSAPGPAGLACATTLAERGHAVTLFEQADEIGGQFNMAKRIPGKEEFDETLRYFRPPARATRRRAAARHARGRARRCAPQASTRSSLATGVMPRDPRHSRASTIRKVLTLCRCARCTAGRSGQRVAIVGAGGIGFDVAEFLVQAPPSPTHRRRRAGRSEWGVDMTLARAAASRSRHAETPPPREVWLLQRKPGRPGARLGKTTGWVHRAR